MTSPAPPETDQPLEAQALEALVTRIVDEVLEDRGSGDGSDASGRLGLAVALTDGRTASAGAADAPFAIQSISKVFALDMALERLGSALMRRVGCEPSGRPFDSIIDLELAEGVPRNPFMNAGALVIVDRLTAAGDADVAADVARRLGAPVTIDEDVVASELDGGDLNRALIGLMRHHGNLQGETEPLLEAYARQCAIQLDCRSLALAGLSLGRPAGPAGSEAERRRRDVLALMMTCGHYDGSGRFAVQVGLPSKSGVSGAVLAVAPGVASIGAWSPRLDEAGNSILAVEALKRLCAETGWSVFGPPDFV